MITNVALVFILCYPYEIMIEDDNECNAHHRPLQPKKKNLDVGFSWVAQNEDKPLDWSSSLR
jgi:hypothetical protein